MIRSCLTCKYKNFVKDSNGMEHEPQYLQTWINNECTTQNGHPLKYAEHIIINCKSWKKRS